MLHKRRNNFSQQIFSYKYTTVSTMLSNLDTAIKTYFETTPTLKWSYLGFLRALKPFCLSDPNSVENQNSIWKKRYCSFLRNFLAEKKKQGLQDEHNKQQYDHVVFLLQQKEFKVEDFWRIVKLEKELVNELEDKRHKSQIDGLELLNTACQQQNHVLVDELNLHMLKKPHLMETEVVTDEKTNDSKTTGVTSIAEDTDNEQSTIESIEYKEILHGKDKDLVSKKMLHDAYLNTCQKVYDHNSQKDGGFTVVSSYENKPEIEIQTFGAYTCGGYLYLFMMDLKYDVIYRFFQLSEIKLAQNIPEFNLVRRLIVELYYFKACKVQSRKTWK
nr:2586_t:CDS:2 [Entrophospora candida]